MDDMQIVDMYWSRSECAISETDRKYGGFLRHIAYNILRSHEDAEECVSDTYMKTWGAIPPCRPLNLSAFTGRITRNLSINRLDSSFAAKRGGGQLTFVLDELRECVSVPGGENSVVDRIVLENALNAFLKSLKPEARKIFMSRYWYMRTVRETAEMMGVGESRVKMSLQRSRKALRLVLHKEGIDI